MPQLTHTANAQQFFLPSTENQPAEERAWVKLDLSPLTAGDLMGISNADVTPTELAATILAGRITEWNYTQADGSPEPISLESIKRLEVADYVYLQQQIASLQQSVTPLSDDEKKA